MPVYNQAEYVSEAIQSILVQTYSDWELIVVDDGSTDSSASVIDQFAEPRIRYIQQKNRGVSAARNTGIANSTGKYLTFLDADDKYHPDKLEIQVDHLDCHPDIGLNYTSRIVINQQGNKLKLSRAPLKTTLKTLVLGWPITINDFMVRRKWVSIVGGFEERFTVNEDRHFLVRISMGGCQFARVDQFLTFRRLGGDKVFSNPMSKLNEALRVLDVVFSDPRYSPKILSSFDQARRNIYLNWAYLAAIQNNYLLARSCFHEVVRLDPSTVEENETQVARFLVFAAIRDGDAHVERLRKVFAGFPREMVSMENYFGWAVARGYLLRGARDIMWNRIEQGETNLAVAAEQGAQLDEPFLRGLIDQLMSYEIAYGPGSSEKILQDLAYYLKPLDAQAALTSMMGNYSINRAFRDYKSSEYEMVPTWVIQAILNNPKYIANKGVLAIFFHSIFQRFY